MKTTLKSLIDIALDKGHISYNLADETKPTTGYMVPKFTVMCEGLEYAVIAKLAWAFFVRNMNEFKRGDLFFGLVVHNGNMYISAQERIVDLELAATRGILRGERFMYDVVNDKEIELPTPQTCGTSYQQTSYAKQAARKIAELI